MSQPPEATRPPTRLTDLGTAEITALAHLYRAEVSRSTAWRTRWMETRFFAPMLLDRPLETDTRAMLAQDYVRPKYHVTLIVAVGRRIRSNYLWILLIQTVAYLGKLVVHPTPVADLPTFIARADVGPIPGEAMLALGALYILSWTGLAIWSHLHDRMRRRKHDGTVPMSFG